MRRAAKQPNECANTVRPVAAMPEATPMAFCSAMPALNVWAGNAFSNFPVLMQPIRSQSICTSFGFSAIISSMAST